MRSFMFLTAFISCLSSMAQIELSSFTSTGRAVATTFVTDYQSLSINPANLGWAPLFNKGTTFGLAEVSVSVYSAALTKQQLRDNIYNLNDVHFTLAEKQDAAMTFANQPLTVNADVMIAGISYQNPKIGGFGFAIRERASWTSQFSTEASNKLFQGYFDPYFDVKLDANGDTLSSMDPNLETKIDKGVSTSPELYTTIWDDSYLKLQWFREYNLSYGRQIYANDVIGFYGGVGLKYLRGYGSSNIEVVGSDMDAWSALSPVFGIDYGTAADNNPSAKTQDGGAPKAVGSGFGVDLGVNAVINGDIRIGLSVVDIGSIRWNGNVYTAENQLLIDMTSEGFNNYNIFSEAEKISGDDGIFEWTGAPEWKNAMPASMRFGGSYTFNDSIAAVGIDMVFPLNDKPGNHQKPVFALGGDFYPIEEIRLSLGLLTGGNYATNLPAGVTFILAKGSWEFGIATRDLITIFSSTTPTLSVAVGVLRFRA